MFVVVKRKRQNGTHERECTSRTFCPFSPRIKFGLSPLFRVVTRNVSSFSELAVALTLHHRVTCKNRERRATARHRFSYPPKVALSELSEFLTEFFALKFKVKFKVFLRVTAFSRRIFAIGQPMLSPVAWKIFLPKGSHRIAAMIRCRAISE